MVVLKNSIGAVSVSFGANIFDAGQVVDKTLIARQRVTVINSAGNPIGYVAAGQPVGVVYSWLDIKPGVRNEIWWAFNQNGIFYYVKHAAGLFDINVLKLQGAVTLEDKYNAAIEQAKADSRGWLSKLLGLPAGSDVAAGFTNVLLYGGLIAAGVYLVGVYIKKKA